MSASSVDGLLGKLSIGGGMRRYRSRGGSDEFKASVKLLGGNDKMMSNMLGSGDMLGNAGSLFGAGYKTRSSQKTGGKGMSRSEYTKYLNNLTVEKLYKVARAKGVKVTTKKNGKISNVKKATIVKKLCDLKHGKKNKKNQKKSKKIKKIKN